MGCCHPKTASSVQKISLDKIISVFLYDTKGEIKNEDLAELKTHNLYDIKNYSQTENSGTKEQHTFDLFNKYYLNLTEGKNNEG